MKIGKMKKLLASVLVLALGFGLINNGVIRADGGESTTEEYTPVITEKENDGLHLKKTAVYNKDNGNYDITLESFVTGKVTTEKTSVPTDIVLVLDMSGSMDYCMVCGKEEHNSWWGHTFQSRISVLKTAVNKFIDQTKVKNNEIKDNDKRHRISLVKFAGKENTNIGNNTYTEDRNKYNYSQIVKGLTTVDEKGANELINSVNSLDPNGSTCSDLGLSRAKKALESSPEDRQKVVIMFTDGEPSSFSDFDSDVANNAILNARNLKLDKTKVYTIGVFADANPGQNINNASRVNRYMHAVSSNYPAATGYSVSEMGTKDPEGNYYKSAKNSDELENIFQEIQDDISSPEINLGSDTILNDTLSDYFTFDITETNKIETYFVKCTEINEAGSTTTYTWDEEHASPVSVNVTKDGNTIEVTGFNYSDNYVHKNLENSNEVFGGKLVVKFSVKPKEGFIGGNAVPTNSNVSGIYTKDGQILDFPEPKVDVNYNYDYSVNSMKDYLSNTWKSFDKVINKQDLDKINGINNKFVYVTFVISDGTKEVGRYKITPGESNNQISFEGSGILLDDPITKSLKVSVEITPINNPVHDSIDNIITEEYTSNSKDAYLYVLVPQIESNDKAIFLGETVDALKSQVVEKDWILKDESGMNATLVGQKPNIDFEITDKDNKNISKFTPNASGEYEFTYKLTANDQDITQYAVKTHKTKLTSKCGENCDKNHFFIVVKSGIITINKHIDKCIDLNGQGDPIFTFKLEGVTSSGKTISEIKTLRFNPNNQTLSLKFENLEKGSYTVTELDVMRYKLDGVIIDSSTNCKTTIVGNSVTFEIGKDKNNEDSAVAIDGSATFNNSLKVENQFSDNGIVTNSFTVDEDGNVTIKQDYHNQSN